MSFCGDVCGFLYVAGLHKMQVPFYLGSLFLHWFISSMSFAQIQMLPSGFLLKNAHATLHFQPVLQADFGAWIKPQHCSQLNKKTLECEMAFGHMKITFLPKHLIELSFKSTRSFKLTGIGLDGSGHLPEVTAFLSNGVQSWSQSGVLAVPTKDDKHVLKSVLSQLDAAEEHRTGESYSWDISFVHGQATSLIAGVTQASRLRTWIQVFQEPVDSMLQIRMRSGGIADQISMESGATFVSDPYRLSLDTDLAAGMKQYGQQVKARAVPRTKKVKIGWNSWYELFSHVSQEDVLNNSALLSHFLERRFKKYDLKTSRPVVFVDDGWERAWGDWQANAKFPLGLKKLAESISAMGFEPGIWIAPLLVRKSLPLVRSKPQWFVQDQLYKHPTGSYAILDVTHPEAAAFLEQSISRLVHLGYQNLKIDFLIAGLYPGKRYEPVTSLEAYHIAMKLIRKAAGNKTFLIGSGAPSLASFPYVDSWRVGPDIAFEVPARYKGPSWIDVANQARNISARWFFCQAIICDADPLLLRGANEKRLESTAWLASLVGGGLFLSDDLSKLPDDAWDYATNKDSLSQFLSGHSAQPYPLIPNPIPRYLKKPRLWDRIFDNKDLNVPSQWILENGNRVFINFSTRTIKVAGKELKPRESMLIYSSFKKKIGAINH